MNDDARVHLEVALEVDGHSIRGTVADGVSPPHEFSGWLELMSAFEIARAKAKADARANAEAQAC